MNDILLILVSFQAFIVAMTFIFVLYRSRVGNKYLEAEKRLRMKLNEATSYFKGDTEKAPDFIGKAIGGMGVDGILDSIGIPSIFKPIAKGFIDKIASNPDALKPILDKLGIVLPDGENTKNQKGSLL
jgi:hypothetical protein